MLDFFTSFEESIPLGFIWTALVSVIISGGVSHFYRSKEIRNAAEIDYEYEQKKKLSELVGGHYGRLVASSSRFNNRMWNLYDHHEKGWTEVEGKYSESEYYFKSFVFRFMELFCVLREVEKSAIHLDTRIAKHQDHAFLNYVSALTWIATDVDLLLPENSGNYDDFDHFYSDNLRQYCDVVCENGEIPTYVKFSDFIVEDSPVLKILQFFDGIKKVEDRHRWDRLVCLHLLLMSFLNSIGPSRYKQSKDDFRKVAAEFSTADAKAAFAKRITNYDLEGDKGLKLLASIL